MDLAKLKGLRAEHSKTQEDVSKFLGISKRSYILKEKGVREFNASEISKLCRLFRVDATIFFEIEVR